MALFWGMAEAGAAEDPPTPTPLSFAAGEVGMELGPRSVLFALKQAREKGGHRDTPEVLQQLPIALSLASGAGSIEANLTGLNVVSLDVTTREAGVDVTLPAAGKIRGTLHSGAGAITLYIPSARSVRFDVMRGGSYISIEEGVKRTGGATSEFDALSDGGAITAEPVSAR